MRDDPDERPLTLAQQRRFTETELRHWEKLTEDARLCALTAIYERRRSRVRQLRQQLEHLDNEQIGDTAHARAHQS